MIRPGPLFPVALLVGAAVGLLSLTSPAYPAEGTSMPSKIISIEGITEYRLDNGVRVLLFPDPSTSKVTVNMTVFVGSRHEGYGETGMAHLLEHMVFKGTPTHPDVPKALRDHGAIFNGTTWVDRTNYFETLNATDENLEFAIRLEADRLVNSNIKREDLASEMTVVRNEFERGENDPEGVLSQRMMAVAYEWHNYGKSTIGNRSDIERVPVDRLRDFYRKYYQPDNVMVVVAGSFKEEKALEYIQKYFGTLKKPERELSNTYTDEPAQDGERNVVLRRVGVVAVIGAVYHIPAGAHADYAATEVLASVLSTPPSGRLYQSLVSTKKATSVTAVAYGWHDPGVLEVLCQVSKGQEVEPVREAVLETLDKVRTGGVTEEEVERARRRLLKNRELLMTDTNRIGVVLSEWAAKGDWRLFFLHRDRVEKVTADDVSRVARLYLAPSNRTVGMYIPAEAPARTDVPATPDITAMMKDYKGSPTRVVAAGEFFDPTIETIESRVKRSRLPGGLKVALLPKKTRGESVTVELTLRYGNEDALRSHTSATQLLGSLMARGTKNRTRQQIEDELDRLQARLRPSSNVGDIGFTLECKRPQLAEALTLLGEILREPSFPEGEFEILKRQARDTLEKGRTEPQPLAGRVLLQKLTPVGKDDIRYVPSIEESIARLDAVTLDEVRKLYTEQVGGTAGELVIVGDFDSGTVLQPLARALEGWKAAVPYRRIERPAIPGVKGEAVRLDTPDKANAIYLAALTLPIKDTNPDNAALEVGNFLFGGGSLSSRLGNRVRQKEGLSYGVASQYGADPLDPSARFLMFAIYNPENAERVAEVIAEELAKMIKEGATEKEVAEARDAYLSQLKVRRSSDAQLATLLQECLHADRTMEYYGDLEKRVTALTAAEVSAAFRKHVDPRKLVIIQAGDFKKKK